MRVTLVVVFAAAIALCVGIVAGMQLDDDPTGGSSSSTCPIVQVPVSDHIEATCIPEAAPLLELFDEPSAALEGVDSQWIGELWLEWLDDGWRLCWVDSTEATRCTSA